MQILSIAILIWLAAGVSIVNGQVLPGLHSKTDGGIAQPGSTSEQDLKKLREENERLRQLIALLEAKIKILEAEVARRSQ